MNKKRFIAIFIVAALMVGSFFARDNTGVSPKHIKKILVWNSPVINEEDAWLNAAEAEMVCAENSSVLYDLSLSKLTVEDINSLCVRLYNKGQLPSFPLIVDAENLYSHVPMDNEPPVNVKLIKITMKNGDWYTLRIGGATVDTITNSSGELIYYVIE